MRIYGRTVLELLVTCSVLLIASSLLPVNLSATLGTTLTIVAAAAMTVTVSGALYYRHYRRRISASRPHPEARLQASPA